MPPAEPAASSTPMRALHELLQRRRDAMVDDIGVLASLESPSGDESGLGRLGELLEARWAALGAGVVVHRAPGVGCHLEIRYPSSAARGTGPGALVLCHMDTVHPVGSLRRNPVRIEGHRLFGPGVQDMKGGIAIALHAAAALGELGIEPRDPLTVLITGDEETGSHSSRALIEASIARSRYALVMEPAGPDGRVKTARKGVGAYPLRVTGVPAHAGLDFESGVDANVELARLVLEMAALTDLDAGTTVNVGVIHGGTVSNVVAEEARAEIDVRFWTMDEARRVDAALRSLSVRAPARLEIGGGINRPPLERNEVNLAPYRVARRLAAAIDYPLEESAVGGASDGNFTSGAGLATLDGLGAVGAELHTHEEWIDVTHLAPRAALTAALLATL